MVPPERHVRGVPPCHFIVEQGRNRSGLSQGVPLPTQRQFSQDVANQVGVERIGCECLGNAGFRHQFLERDESRRLKTVRTSKLLKRRYARPSTRARQIFGINGFTDELFVPGIVSRCEGRHPGALGAAGCADGGRPVCTQNV